MESGVGHAQKTPLKGLVFETIEAAPAASRPVRRTLGRQGRPGHPSFDEPEVTVLQVDRAELFSGVSDGEDMAHLPLILSSGYFA